MPKRWTKNYNRGGFVQLLLKLSQMCKVAPSGMKIATGM